MEREPECFGHEWSISASECTGGYDPGFVSPTGGHVRPRCDHFDSCKVKSLLRKANVPSPQIIPPASLIRPSYTPMSQQPVVTPYAPSYVPGRPPQQTQPSYGAQYPQIQMDPIRMVPMAHEMPAYLTVHEQRHEGESYWSPLWRIVLRSIGKAVGHALSNFFDRSPLKPLK